MLCGIEFQQFINEENKLSIVSARHVEIDETPRFSQTAVTNVQLNQCKFLAQIVVFWSMSAREIFD